MGKRRQADGEMEKGQPGEKKNARRSDAKQSEAEERKGKRGKATEKSRRGDETSSIERFLKGDANERPFKGILAKGAGDLVDPPTGFERIRGGSFVVFRFANCDNKR